MSEPNTIITKGNLNFNIEYIFIKHFIIFNR